MSDPQPRVATRPQRGRSRLIVVAVLAVLLLIFIFSNTASVKLSFVFIDFSMPVWLLTILLLAIGVVAGLLVGAYARKSKR
jgi:uncharacterized integral membrane protein